MIDLPPSLSPPALHALSAVLAIVGFGWLALDTITADPPPADTSPTTTSTAPAPAAGFDTDPPVTGSQAPLEIIVSGQSRLLAPANVVEAIQRQPHATPVPTAEGQP